ncbi:MAG: hypothetical protein JSV79_08605 [Armatimonadota bacterium]|nr:MAG: hypothetical protein JSV79_08605 [Armatimonadota bacterium]
MKRRSQVGGSRRRLRRRLKLGDLLRGPKWEWDFLHIAEAYAARQQQRADSSLNDFAVEHGALASPLYQETKERNLVLWHGTSLERAEKILEHGFFHCKGVWMAVKTSTPLTFARNRAREFDGRPAILVSVIDLDRYREGVHFDERWGETRFRDDVPPDVVQYLLTDREFRYVGEGRTAGYRLPVKASFVRRKRGWASPTQNPATFDARLGLTYTMASEWLGLKLDRFFAEQRRATALEAFCAVYANCHPTEAISREKLAGWLMSECETAARSRWGPLLCRSRSA